MIPRKPDICASPTNGLTTPNEREKSPLPLPVAQTIIARSAPLQKWDLTTVLEYMTTKSAQHSFPGSLQTAIASYRNTTAELEDEINNGCMEPEQQFLKNLLALVDAGMSLAFPFMIKREDIPEGPIPSDKIDEFAALVAYLQHQKTQLIASKANLKNVSFKIKRLFVGAVLFRELYQLNLSLLTTSPPLFKCFIRQLLDSDLPPCALQAVLELKKACRAQTARPNELSGERARLRLQSRLDVRHMEEAAGIKNRFVESLFTFPVSSCDNEGLIEFFKTLSFTEPSECSKRLIEQAEQEAASALARQELLAEDETKKPRHHPHKKTSGTTSTPISKPNQQQNPPAPSTKDPLKLSQFRQAPSKGPWITPAYTQHKKNGPRVSKEVPAPLQTPYEIHERVQRWPHSTPSQIRAFEDTTKDGSRICRYATLSETALEDQRRRHTLPKELLQLLADPSFRKNYTCSRKIGADSSVEEIYTLVSYLEPLSQTIQTTLACIVGVIKADHVLIIHFYVPRPNEQLAYVNDENNESIIAVLSRAFPTVSPTPAEKEPSSPVHEETNLPIRALGNLYLHPIAPPLQERGEVQD